MPEINIPFDLPFEYCKYCKELAPGIHFFITREEAVEFVIHV